MVFVFKKKITTFLSKKKEKLQQKKTMDPQVLTDEKVNSTEQKPMDPQVPTDEKVKLLAKDPRNKVYVSRHLLPEPVLPVEQLMKNCWKRFSDLRDFLY
jgi:hypothetical protein